MTYRPEVEAFFHAPSNTVTYLVWDPTTMRGAIIDPVLDFTLASATASTGTIDAVILRASNLGIDIAWVLETHVHADHLSAAQRVIEKTGAPSVIGAAVTIVQQHFAPIFGIEMAADGSEFDLLVTDGDTLELGALQIAVMTVPGHTPADIAYLIGDALFVGDTLFMPDYGTARCDFPGGSARQLHQSIKRLLDLPGSTRMYICHDYKAPGRDTFAWETTVAEQRNNVHVNGASRDGFVAMREARDAGLPVPAMLLAALQVNIRGGRMPDVLQFPVSWMATQP